MDEIVEREIFEEVKAKPRKLRKSRKGDYEYYEQADFVSWLREKEIFHFHPINGVHLEPWRREQLKTQGMISGIPDIIVLVPLRSLHGLMIEMKRKKGGIVSKEQKSCLEKLNGFGYHAVVCNGCDEAVVVTCEYFGREDWLKEYRKDGESML